MRLKDVADLQKGYDDLVSGQKLTKKILIALVVPFRDKYCLTDKQALMIARKEYTLSQVCELLSKPVTHGDEYRAMPDEELAWTLIFYRDDWGDYDTPAGVFDEREEAYKKTVEWLKQPAETAPAEGSAK